MSRMGLSRTLAGSRVCRQRVFVQRERLLFRTLMQGLQWKNVYKMTQLPSGPYIKGESVLKSAKIGVGVSEAKCAGPLSLLISKSEKLSDPPLRAGSYWNTGAIGRGLYSVNWDAREYRSVRDDCCGRSK